MSFQRLFSNFQLISTQNFLLFDFVQLESTITFNTHTFFRIPKHPLHNLLSFSRRETVIKNQTKKQFQQYVLRR